MNFNKQLLRNYESTLLIKYDEIDKRFVNNVYAYEDLPQAENDGVLKANVLVGGKLRQLYTERASHVAVVAATRQGKTTSYVIPTILSICKSKRKKSMIISDPKGELYRLTSKTLEQEGYRVKLLNFRDAKHSEFWNPLLPIYYKYRAAMSIGDTVVREKKGNRYRYRFDGETYDSEKKVNAAVSLHQSVMMDDVSNDIDQLSCELVQTKSEKDPYWEDAARDMFKAFIWGMLEDTDPNNPMVKKGEVQRITENTFTFNTMLTILNSFKDTGRDTVFNDKGYFSDRSKDSRAYSYAKNSFLENAPTTRKCVVSCFTAKIAIFRDIAVKLITTCNTIDFDEMIDRPTAIFIDYKDEVKMHYNVISLFIQEAYRHLISVANLRPNGQFDIPFYFILDEFGNFPRLHDFETTISACGGRNIYFILILQSYAQLNNVYGEATAEIIKDNLNMHVFFGSNNVNTLSEFSKECGEFTRVSPLSALNGTGGKIENYMLETIPLVPKSQLAYLKPGECVITEVNCGYVLWSKLERFYLCDQFNRLPLNDYHNYVSAINPYDEKYRYTFRKELGYKNFFS